jgi:hypothetical protein
VGVARIGRVGWNTKRLIIALGALSKSEVCRSYSGRIADAAKTSRRGTATFADETDYVGTSSSTAGSTRTRRIHSSTVSMR